MKKIILILALLSNVSLYANEGKKGSKEKDETASASNIDLDVLKKDVINEPKFSSESSDQEKIDKELSKNNTDSLNSVTKHVLEFQNCGKLGVAEKIIACRKQLQK